MPACCTFGGWHEGVQYALQCCFARFGLHLFARAFAFEFEAGFDQVADDAVHVAANVADFGEFGRLDFDEWRFGEFCQAARDFGFADAGRANHQDVFRRDFAAHRLGDLPTTPAAAQGVGNGAFCRFLADDVAVEFFHDFAWGHVEVAVFGFVFHVSVLL